MPCFNYYKDLFYINTKKVIPLNIGKLLTSRGLAYWAMDDGSYDGLGGFKLSTNSYTKEEVELLINVFKNKFNIIGKLGKVKPNQYIIRFGRKEYIKFKILVLPYFHHSMLYKLPIYKK
jgi:hypothetical protein